MISISLITMDFTLTLVVFGYVLISLPFSPPTLGGMDVHLNCIRSVTFHFIDPKNYVFYSKSVIFIL